MRYINSVKGTLKRSIFYKHKSYISLGNIVLYFCSSRVNWTAYNRGLISHKTELTLLFYHNCCLGQLYWWVIMILQPDHDSSRDEPCSCNKPPSGRNNTNSPAKQDFLEGRLKAVWHTIEDASCTTVVSGWLKTAATFPGHWKLSHQNVSMRRRKSHLWSHRAIPRLGYHIMRCSRFGVCQSSSYRDSKASVFFTTMQQYNCWVHN